MAMTVYKYQAQALMRDYLLADPLVPYTSVLVGIVLCKMAYDLTRILSSFYFKVSVGYFISDLAMIFWLYPSLGGLEYILHHILSVVAIAYTMLSGEGQFYTYMILISETTTPEINLRWFLDTAGLKKSNAYLVNGGKDTLVHVRILPHLFPLQSGSADACFGYYLTFVVPSVLFVMNTLWFMKILKGVKKTLSKWP
ncbi:hypothetical protein GUJ93_ZPchr0003g18476 [Zizania palustris]|uniref:TLC domain-containing protein n=1 Tax=Zizania palustris TaxID=103762 RepID=A0A8J5VWQ0_ZIZPA|nr:hypothetical protein GUJ93_ZPchr0003g18476 [Zizania palustris]